MVAINIHFIMDIMLKCHLISLQVYGLILYLILIFLKDKTWSLEAVENFSQKLSFMKIKEETMKNWFKYVSCTKIDRIHAFQYSINNLQWSYMSIILNFSIMVILCIKTQILNVSSYVMIEVN